MLIIILLSDLKLIIAYSSVFYINLSLIVLGFNIDFFILVMLNHRICSILIFLYFNINYQYSNRRILLFKGLLVNISKYTIFIFFLYIICLGNPFSIIFFCELFIIVFLYINYIYFTYFFLFVLFILILYNIIIYVNLNLIEYVDTFYLRDINVN